MTSAPARDLSCLVTAFAERVPGVAHAVVVSSDGLLVAASDRLTRDRADQFAAAVSGLVSVTCGAARIFDDDEIRQTVVETGRWYFLVMSIRDGSILAAVASQDSDVGVIGYEMARLVKQAGDLLTPMVRDELRRSLPH